MYDSIEYLFFEEEEEEEEEAPLKVIINGQEYDSTEAQEFIETGRKTKELETKYNTSLDKVWPDYNRVSQERKQLEQELADAKAQLTEFSSKQKQGNETPSDVVEAREAAKKLGIVLDDDLGKAGYVKKEDLNTWYKEQRQREQEVNKVLADADKLEKDINGSDGRPAFNKKVVLAYANTYGITDLTEAYEDMHKPAIDAWKEAQIATQRARSLKTTQGGGAKAPKTPKVNDDNVKDQMRELLWGAKDE